MSKHKVKEIFAEEYPRARVRDVDGQIVLDDPDALAVIRAVGKHNCKTTLEINAERVSHFKTRLAERELSDEDYVIVVLNVDEPFGGQLAEVLMPGQNWQEIRDRGEIPFARGLVDRQWMEEAIDFLDHEASTKLGTMTGLAVVVVDHGVAEIFPA